MEDPTNCVPTYFTYEPGVFEQGRNVSELIGNKVTVLDPRYSPTGGMKLYSDHPYRLADREWLHLRQGCPIRMMWRATTSKFFLAYETGDNTNAAEYMATPMDMLYSRATVWGDVYEKMEYDISGEIVWRWPWVEIDQEDLSGEASMLANPGGTFMYIVWNQWEEEYMVDEFGIEHEVCISSNPTCPSAATCTCRITQTIKSAPVATILSAPSTALLGDPVTFLGSGYDADDPDGENNITNYVWYSSLDGLIEQPADLHHQHAECRAAYHHPDGGR